MMTQKLSLSRRDLFTVAGAFGLTTASAECSALVGMTKEEFETFHATCSMECIHCNLKAFVKDGRIVRIESDNPYDGKGCARGLSRIKWVYAKNRIRTPLKRVGERGEGKFVPISWDEALDTVASKMKEAINKDGSKSILMTSASGNMDSMTNGVMKALGAHLGGVTHQVGSLCCSAVTAAMNEMVGRRYVDTRDTIQDSSYILCWGNNPIVTMQAYWPRYLEAKKRGAKMVVIDPRKSETAARADEWISIVPGTDAALALGMIREIVHNKWCDDAFLIKHTGAPYLVGPDGKLLRESEDSTSYLVYDELSQKVVRHDGKNIRPALHLSSYALPKGTQTVFEMIEKEAEAWTPEATEKETGVPAAKIKELAKEYATSKASMIVANMGSFQRVEYGTYAAASHFYLALLTGQICRSGTGVCDAGGVTQMAKFGSPIQAPEKKPEKVPGIPTAKLGEWVLNDKPHKINVWYSMTCGLVGQWPNTNMVIKALKHVPFVVVADNIMTPTCRYADIVLPATTVFEYKSLTAGARTHFVQWSDEAVKPEGEAKPDRWIIAELAKRLGVGKYFDLTPEQMAERVLEPSGIKLEDVVKAPVSPVKAPWIPYANGQFYTKTKKANLFCESFVQRGYKPILTYMRAIESPKGSPDLAKKYPLQAIQRKVIRNIHTSHQDNEWIKATFPNKPTVLIHSKDAERFHIAHGDMTVVYNDRGEHRAVAIVSENIREGVVCLENGWWQDTDGFNSSSVLTNDRIEELGSATTICSTLVGIRRA